MRNMIYNSLLWIFLAVILGISGCNHKPMYLQPQSSVDIDASPWGVEFNALPPHIDKYPHELEGISSGRIDSIIAGGAALGIKWVRLSVNWSNVVDTSGAYHWEQVDKIINGLYNNKIEIGLCITGGHKLYTNGLSPATPQDIEHWTSFVRVFVDRYKDKISHWELWNEPNTPWFWKPRPHAANYVRLMKEFHYIVKEIVPHSRIVGGSLARLDMVWADSILKLGVGQYIDAITYHPYNEIPEAIIMPVRKSVKTPYWYLEADHSIFQFQELVHAHNPNIRMWQGECGYPSEDNGSGWMGLGPWSPAIQAKWLLRRMLVDLSYNAEVINYFCMVEYVTGGNVDAGTGVINSKGLLHLDDLTEKPAYDALRNLNSAINGNLQASVANHYKADIVKEGSFHNIMPKNIMFLDIENHRDEDYLAYWIVWRMQDIVDHATVSITTPKSFQDPVVINLLTGEVVRVSMKTQGDQTQLLNLPLADYPYVITEFNNVKIQ
jgi:polysaccharide biosynthesis protein PslG